jgi:TPR repeat protein
VEENPGVARLQFQYGRALERGERYLDAVVWYENAVAQGYATAGAHLGNMYETGRGVAQDDSEALRWYCKAAAQADENRAAADWARVELQRLGAD